MSKSLDERFWSKVDKDGPTMSHMDSNCWVWTAGKSGNGYGYIRVNGKLMGAHSAGWLLQTGEEPTFLRHRCDNRLCVRASHLIDGEYAEQHRLNMQDMVDRGRCSRPKGEKNGRARLTESLVKEIRRRYADGELQRTLAMDYGVTGVTIGLIVRRKRWAHVS